VSSTWEAPLSTSGSPALPEAPVECESAASERRIRQERVAPLFTDKAAATLVAVILFPSPEAGLETRIRWGCLGCWTIFVHRMRYGSLGRPLPFLNESSGDGAGTQADCLDLPNGRMLLRGCPYGSDDWTGRSTSALAPPIRLGTTSVPHVCEGPD
jgi:hypothetical protein